MKKFLAMGLACALALVPSTYAKAAGLCYAGGCNLGECFMDADYDGICGNHYFLDANGDGICDYHFYWDANGDGICDLYIDVNGDGICDHCHDHGRIVQPTAAGAATQQPAVAYVAPVQQQPAVTYVAPVQQQPTVTYNYGYNSGYYGGGHHGGGHHGGHH